MIFQLQWRKNIGGIYTFFFSFEANHPHALLKIHKKYPITGILIKQPPQMPQNSPRWQMKDNGHIYLFQEKYIFLTDPV